MNPFSVAGFKPVNNQGGNIEVGGVIYALAADRSAAKPVVPGRWLKLTGSADSAGRPLVDTCVAADFANGAAKVIIGPAAIVFDSEGRQLLIQHLGATTAGLVQAWSDPKMIFVGQMSGVPTAYGGSFKILDSALTVSSYDPATAEEPYPEPILGDKIDSASYHATVTQLGLMCLGAYGTAVNRDTVAAMPAYVRCNPAHHYLA